MTTSQGSIRLHRRLSSWRMKSYQAKAQKSTQRLLALLNKELVIELKVSCLRRTTIPASQG